MSPCLGLVPIRRCSSTLAIGSALLVTSACTPGLPGVNGAPATSPAPSAAWTPPGSEQETAPRSSGATIPADLAEQIRTLTLTDVVDLALRNNAATQFSWASARAAAAAYGSVRGSFYPQVDLEVSGTRLKTVASQGRSAVQQTVWGPSATLSYLLFDFGGRSGAVSGAREALVAADWTHNATVQEVMLQAEAAFFQYLGTRALLIAQLSTVKEAETNLGAAEERHRVGLATIADVLQARTALSNARLAAVTTEGALATSKGSLAVAMGLPANLPFDVDSVQIHTAVRAVADSVDSLIDRAVRDRPDLAAARAEVRQSEALVTERRAARLPALALSGTGGYTSVAGNDLKSNYTVTLGLQIPLFAGFSRAYNQAEARALADAATARMHSLEQQVVFQVFTSYFGLQTATRRVATTDDLLASATQSAEVALGRYRAGVGSVIDLLTAEAALADARSQQVLARFGWYTAFAQLTHDIGALDRRAGAGSLRLVGDSTPPSSSP